MAVTEATMISSCQQQQSFQQSSSRVLRLTHSFTRTHLPRGHILTGWPLPGATACMPGWRAAPALAAASDDDNSLAPFEALVAQKRFHCTQCGKCCTGDGEVWVADEEAERIAAYLSMPLQRFYQQYTRAYSKVEGFKLLRAKSNPTRDCIFLQPDNTCSIHKVRPLQCSTYPWWPDLMSEQDWTWEKENICEGFDHPDAPPTDTPDAARQLRAATAMEYRRMLARRPSKKQQKAARAAAVAAAGAAPSSPPAATQHMASTAHHAAASSSSSSSSSSQQDGGDPGDQSSQDGGASRGVGGMGTDGGSTGLQAESQQQQQQQQQQHTHDAGDGSQQQSGRAAAAGQPATSQGLSKKAAAHDKWQQRLSRLQGLAAADDQPT